MALANVRTSRRLPRIAAIFGRAILSSVLGLGLVATGPGVARLSAADISSDIPGVPLTDPVVAGRLGGAIYDVVYRVTVPAGHVIVASLTGTAGTDFDLYLFDSSATSVVSPVGLLAKSIGPTSSEAVSWPSRFGGTYYIDLNGSTDLEGDYRLVVQTIPDPTPPIVGLTLAAGRQRTNQLTVPVAISATDDLSGVTEVALSGDGTTFADWQPFTSTSSWTFGPGDGVKTLWAKVRNGVGLESTAAKATITLDTAPPSAVAIEPSPGATVVGLRPTFDVTFDEPMDPETWMDLGLIVQAANGGLVPGTYAYDSSRRRGSFTPTVDLVPGAVYIVTIGNVADLAGNRGAPRGSWTITPLAASGLAARAAPSVILRGGSTRIVVTMSHAPVVTTVAVLVQVDPLTGFQPYATIPVANGVSSLDATPYRNTTYRFGYAGDAETAPAVVDVPIAVRRSITLAGAGSSALAKATVGRAVTLRASIGPVAPKVSISFRLYRFDAVQRIWVYAGSRGRTTDSSGRTSVSWVPSSSGRYYWRAFVASTADYANNTSAVYRWSVSR